jgi:hypothetical protein
MGLDFYELELGCSYGGFALFRQMLADGIGWHDYGCHFTDWAKPSQLKKYKDDPIFPFLMRSDCDGEMEPEECIKVAPRIRELVESWSDSGKSDRGRWKPWAIKLADGMERLAA